MLRTGLPAPSANCGGSACSAHSRIVSQCMPILCSRPSSEFYRQHSAHVLHAAATARVQQGRQMRVQACDGVHGNVSNTPSAIAAGAKQDSLWSRLNWELLLLVSAIPAGPALAEGVKYNASQGEGLVKTMSGVAYIGLLLYFLTRVLNRRARKAREERLAGQGPVRTIFTTWIEKATDGKEKPQVTPVNAAIGAAQAGAIAYGLFIFSTKVTDLIQGQDLPVGYTAQNIAITVRTIIIGLLYLATFIFSANAVGLTALTVQMLFFPHTIVDEADLIANKTPQGPQLPKVSVTSSPEEIKRAFEAVSRTAASSNGSSFSSSSSSMDAASEPAGSTQVTESTAAATASKDSS